MNIPPVISNIAVAFATVLVGLPFVTGVFIEGLATAHQIDDIADMCVEEINKSDAQTDECIAKVHEVVAMSNSLVEKMRDSPKEREVADSLHNCVQGFKRATAIIEAGNAKREGIIQSLDDDIDRFAEDTKIITRYNELLPRESALHLAMVDHLNQVGLENLTFETDGLEYDGEGELLMNNCTGAGDDDECTPMAMKVTMHDNGTFMLGDPEPLEQ